MRLVKSALSFSIQTVVLNFYCRDVETLVQLDWSPLLGLGVHTEWECPRIELCFRGVVRDTTGSVLVGNEALKF